MNKKQKQQIKEIIDDNFNINDILDKIYEIDEDNELSIWQQIINMEEFFNDVRQTEDNLYLVEKMENLTYAEVANNDYIYFDGVNNWYSADYKKEDIINEILEELD